MKIPIVDPILVCRYLAMTPVTCCVHTAPSPYSLLYTLVPPLTVENIQTAVQGVAWRELGERLFPCSRSFTYPKLDEIAQQHQSDDSRLRAVIECWLQGEGKDNEPSWRALILALDGATETRSTADPIRHFAEPLPGVQCISPASHQIVFIPTQGVCDHMYMYVDHYSLPLHLLWFQLPLF